MKKIKEFTEKMKEYLDYINGLSNTTLFGTMTTIAFIFVLISILVPYYSLRFDFGTHQAHIYLLTVLMKNQGVWISFALFTGSAFTTLYHWYVLDDHTFSFKVKKVETEKDIEVEEEIGDKIPEAEDIRIMSKEDIEKLAELEKVLEV